MKSNGKKIAMYVHSEFKIELFLLRLCLWPLFLVILLNSNLQAGLFGGTRCLLAGLLEATEERAI